MFEEIQEQDQVQDQMQNQIKEYIHPSTMKTGKLKQERKMYHEARQNMVNQIERSAGKLLSVNWHNVTMADIEKLYLAVRFGG